MLRPDYRWLKNESIMNGRTTQNMNSAKPSRDFAAKVGRLCGDLHYHFVRITRKIKDLRQKPRGDAGVQSDTKAALCPLELADTFDAMYIVAHPDDTLLFQSPSLLQNIRSGLRVVTVHLTAGDAGLTEKYWRGREAGIAAAYARMADAPNTWATESFAVAGHHIALHTLQTSANVVIVFLRLPDGGFPDGKGTRKHRYQSLMQLWRGKERLIVAVDGSNSFDRDDLIVTLVGLMNAFRPSLIATQDFASAPAGLDHPDHYATALFSRKAHRLYERPHSLAGHVGYDGEHHPANIHGQLLANKQEIFYLYGAFDELACDSELACSGSPYAAWLQREYISASEFVGAVDFNVFAQPASLSKP